MNSSVVITLDFELGWGSILNEKWREREMQGVYSRLRRVVPELLKIFQNLEISSTWGVVGALVGPIGTQELDHLPVTIKEKTRKALKSGQPKTFDGRDLVDVLIKGEPYISLCSHSYSHVRVDAFEENETDFQEEMLLYNSATATLQPEKKLIFPENIEGFYNILDGLGYQKVRGAELKQNDNDFINKVKNNLLRSPPLSRFKKIGKHLVRETGSLFYNARGIRWRRYILENQCRRGLSNIIRNGGVFHIYNHPFNLAEDNDLYKSYIKLLYHVAMLRDQGHLTIDKF